jgi:hypothetical protein
MGLGKAIASRMSGAWITFGRSMAGLLVFLERGRVRTILQPEAPPNSRKVAGAVTPQAAVQTPTISRYSARVAPPRNQVDLRGGREADPALCFVGAQAGSSSIRGRPYSFVRHAQVLRDGAGAGKSSLAEAAAKAITARTSSSIRLGNSLRMFAMVSLRARYPNRALGRVCPR